MNYYAYIDNNNIVRGVLQTSASIDLESFIGVVSSGMGILSWIDRKQWDGEKFVNYSPPVRILTKYEFLTRFTAEERVNILNAAKTDVEIEMFMQLVNAATEINLDDSNTTLGLQLLASKNLILVERVQEILS